MKHLKTMLFLAFIFLLIFPASATVIDIGCPYTYEKNYVTVSNSARYSQVAYQWSDTQSATINQVYLGIFEGNAAGYDLSIRNDNGGVPGNIVYATAPRTTDTGGSEKTYLFQLNTTTTLVANTPYWVVLDGRSAGDGTSWDAGLINGRLSVDGNIPINTSKWAIKGWTGSSWVPAESGSGYDEFGCIELLYNNKAVGARQAVYEERTHILENNDLDKTGQLITNAPNVKYNINNLKVRLYNSSYKGNTYFVVLDKNWKEIANRSISAPVVFDWRKQTLTFTPPITIGPGNSTIVALIKAPQSSGNQNDNCISVRANQYFSSDVSYPYGERFAGTKNTYHWTDGETLSADAMMNMSISFGDPTDTNTYFVSPLIGDDSNPGTTAVYPWKTLAYASTHLPAHSSLWLMPGNYKDDSFIAYTSYINISASSINANLTGTSSINGNGYSNIKVDGTINNLTVTGIDPGTSGSTNDYFVSPLTGSDSNNGSASYPWKKLAYASTHLPAHSSLWLMPGNYKDDSFTAHASYINISAFSTNANLTGTSSIYGSGYSNIKVDGINFNYLTGTGTAVEFDYGDNIIIQNCIIKDGYDGIRFRGGNNTLAQNNFISNMSQHGIHLYNQYLNPIYTNNNVIGNNISDCGHNMIDVHSNISHCTIANNDVYITPNCVQSRDNVGVYLHNGNTTYIIVSNNTLHHMGRPLELNNVNNSIIQNNNFYDGQKWGSGSQSRILIEAVKPLSGSGNPAVPLGSYGCNNITFSGNVINGLGRAYDFYSDGSGTPVAFSNFIFKSNVYNNIGVITLRKATPYITTNFAFIDEGFSNFTIDWYGNKINDGDFVFSNSTYSLYAKPSGKHTLLQTVQMSLPIAPGDTDIYYVSPLQTNGTNDYPVFPGYTNPPTDVNHDGLYEDINGNGILEFDDVVAYYINIEWIGENAPVNSFDYNKNGSIDFDDAVKLYNML